MLSNMQRCYLVELVGSFGLVFFSAGVVCINYMAIPVNQPGGTEGTAPLNLHQPGLVGTALAQGLIFAVLLAVTVPVSGGYLNPAIALMLWVFNRLESRRLAWLVGAQLLGAFLAGLCLRATFDMPLLQKAHFGTPQINLQAYARLEQSTRYAGVGIELVLTFFLVYAIFAAASERPRLAGWAGGAALAAAVLVGHSLTGAALNPARWFGTVLWEAWDGASSPIRGPFDDVLVYLAGPILGAMVGGAFCFLVYLPGVKATALAETGGDGPAAADEERIRRAAQIKLKK